MYIIWATQLQGKLLAHLWVGCLCDNVSYGVGVSGQRVDAGLSSHVPHLKYTIELRIHNTYIHEYKGTDNVNRGINDL